MFRNDMRPYTAIAFAALAAIVFTAWSDRNRSLTFEQRWSAVDQIDAGWKGDRLDKPPYVPPLQWQQQPTMQPLPLLRIHETATGAECPWNWCVLT